MAFVELFDPRVHPILVTGLATFFFGFGAGALLNLYLIAVHSPLVAELRGSLDFKSSIVGDGILLPLVNMLVVSALRLRPALVGRREIAIAVVLGIVVTVYFHVVQAARGLVNWAMPRPWRWNLLGVWHAAYMLTVSTLLALFYVVVIDSVRAHDAMVRDAVVVTAGIALFFLLLRLDYVSVEFGSLLPRRVVEAWPGHRDSPRP